MDKLVFWGMVAVAGVLGVWGVKFLAAQTQVTGLRAFASQL